MAEEKDAAPARKGGGGLSKIIILGLLVCNVLSLGGVAAFAFLGADDASAGADGATEAEDSEVHAPGESESASGDAESGSQDGIKYKTGDLGPTVKLGKFTINLNNPGHPRYLRVDLKAEVSDEKTRAELVARDPQVRDILISYLSSLTLKETYGARAKASIRDNISRRLNSILTSGEITRVFFTDFMTQ